MPPLSLLALLRHCLAAIPVAAPCRAARRPELDEPAARSLYAGYCDGGAAAATAAGTSLPTSRQSSAALSRSASLRFYSRLI